MGANYCTECGLEIKTGDRFCQNTDAKTTAYSEHTNKTKNILIVSIIAVLIIIGIFLLFI